MTVPQTSIVCIPDVRVTFGGASIFDTSQNADASAGDCTLNDASAFALAGDTDGFQTTRKQAKLLQDGINALLKLTRSR